MGRRTALSLWPAFSRLIPWRTFFSHARSTIYWLIWISQTMIVEAPLCHVCHIVSNEFGTHLCQVPFGIWLTKLRSGVYLRDRNQISPRRELARVADIFGWVFCNINSANAFFKRYTASLTSVCNTWTQFDHNELLTESWYWATSP